MLENHKTRGLAYSKLASYYSCFIGDRNKYLDPINLTYIETLIEELNTKKIIFRQVVFVSAIIYSNIKTKTKK